MSEINSLCNAFLTYLTQAAVQRYLEERHQGTNKNPIYGILISYIQQNLLVYIQNLIDFSFFPGQHWIYNSRTRKYTSIRRFKNPEKVLTQQLHQLDPSDCSHNELFTFPRAWFST